MGCCPEAAHGKLVLGYPGLFFSDDGGGLGDMEESSAELYGSFECRGGIRQVGYGPDGVEDGWNWPLARWPLNGREQCLWHEDSRQVFGI